MRLGAIVTGTEAAMLAAVLVGALSRCLTIRRV
jgi:hypothetical protein